VPGSSGVGEFVWLDKLYEVSASLVVSWSAAASGPPTIFGTDIVAAVVGSDVLSYAIATGQPVRTVHLGTTPPTGAAVYPLGAGLLITGAGVTFYRAA
jgi:hypothetical protein